MPRAAKPDPGPLSLAVAEILRAQVGRLGVPKTAVAAATGRSYTQVNEIIRGVSQADIEQLDDICQALGLDLTATIREAEELTTNRLIESGVQPLDR